MSSEQQKCVRVAISAVGLALCAAQGMAQGPEKAQQSYQTFYFKNAVSRNVASDIQTSMRNMIPGAKIYYAATENALSISGTSDELSLAQKMLADLDKPQKVYRVTYTISAGHNAGRHLMVLVAPGKTSMTRQGTRVPIMTGSFNEAGGGRANTQFQYLDVGLSVNASLEGYGDGLRLMSKIEETSVSEQKSNVGIQDPIVNQSVLEAPAEVNSGKPVMLGSLEMPDGNRVDVQVTAEVLQ